MGFYSIVFWNNYGNVLTEKGALFHCIFQSQKENIKKKLKSSMFRFSIFILFYKHPVLFRSGHYDIKLK